MGLLDNINGMMGYGMDDPRTQATLGLAAQLLGGKGNGMQRLTDGMSAYGHQISQAKQTALKQRLLDAQIAETLAQAQERKAAAGKRGDMQATLQSILGGQGAPSQYGVGGGGVSLGGVREPMAPQRGGLAGAPAELIAALKAQGVDLTDLWKTEKFGEQANPGTYRLDSKGGQRYLVDPTKGQTINNGRVGIAPGALETNAALAGATADATEEAKAKYDLVPTYNNGTPGFSSRASILGLSQNQQPSAPSPGVVNRGTIQDDITNGAQFSSPDVERRVRALAGQQPQGFQSGPSQTQKQANTAAEDINKNWITNSYNSVIKSGDAASSTLTNIQSARFGLSNVGATGWGKEAQVAAARVLGAFGVPQADKLAAGAQIFQNAALSRAQTVLSESTGTQTEGDATRVAQLWAKLSNTPQANAYLLDLMQALAERDAKKAAWYRDALPLGRQAGDLQMIDRKWQERAPSVWGMPSLQKWKP